MNEKVALLDRYLLSRDERLEAGEVLTVKLNDGLLTAFKEEDPETKEKRTVTLVEKFDGQLDLSVEDLIL